MGRVKARSQKQRPPAAPASHASPSVRRPPPKPDRSFRSPYRLSDAAWSRLCQAIRTMQLNEAHQPA